MNRQTTLLLTLLLSALSPVTLAASLPDTGQVVCDDGTNPDPLVACSNLNSGDASTMPRQDGRFGRDAAVAAGIVTKVGGGEAGSDYSKVANDGSILVDSATQGYGTTDWACTRDNLTGLIWELKTLDNLLQDEGTSYSWYSSDGSTNGSADGVSTVGTENGGSGCVDLNSCDTEKYVAEINAIELCGYTDWRLPSIRELETIVRLGNVNPAMDLTYFPNGLYSGQYWSATRDFASFNDGAWDIDFGSGGVESNALSSSLYVRLVRGGPF